MRQICGKTQTTKEALIRRQRITQGYSAAVKAQGKELPWDQMKSETGGRTTDTWKPLLCVARYLDDEEWLALAENQIDKATGSLKQRRAADPTQVVFSMMVALALDLAEGEPGKDAKSRRLIKDLVSMLKAEGHELNSWQVGRTLRRLGFAAKRIGGG